MSPSIYAGKYIRGPIRITWLFIRSNHVILDVTFIRGPYAILGVTTSPLRRNPYSGRIQGAFY
jgi:hypothetical protein